jgi:L-cysteate sulfo-lyase
MLFSRFPRVRLAHLPTPLEHLPRLSEYLGGPKIYVKRDDCTGLATGGNKTRKLEFSMGEAVQQGADTIITVGAVQSNHVRQTAAAAAKLGMNCEVLLEHRIEKASDAYLNSGNVLLDRMFGANLHEYPGGTDFEAEMNGMADSLREQGKIPYIVPGGASNKVGALGYANCALELINQATEDGIVIDHIITATGSAGTQAGLIAGLKALNSNVPLLGICVSINRQAQEEKVFALAVETAEHLGAPGAVERDDVVANSDYVGPGYGRRTDEMNEAVMLLARLEGLLFDPVYSGKALAGMIDLVRKGEFAADDNIVFLHTGGSAALFAYADQLEFEV